MGRPRKWRRGETGDTEHQVGNKGALEAEAADAADVGFEDIDYTPFSGAELALGGDGLHFSDDSFQRQDVVPLEASIRPSIYDLNQGFTGWDVPQDLFPPFSLSVDGPLLLPTPPSAPDEVSSNNHTAGDAVTGCSCLSNLYSVLAKFQSLPEPSFPFSMGELKRAAALCPGVVSCQSCPQAYNTALQNAMLLGTLLQLLIVEYSKLLGHIDAKSKQSQKIAFRLGDTYSL